MPPHFLPAMEGLIAKEGLSQRVGWLVNVADLGVHSDRVSPPCDIVGTNIAARYFDGFD